MNLNLKSAHLIFWFFVDNLKTIVVGFVGMWENRRFFQVIVESVGKSSIISLMESLFPIG